MTAPGLEVRGSRVQHGSVSRRWSLPFAALLALSCASGSGVEDAGPGGDRDAGPRIDAERPPPGPVPATLSETGLYASGVEGPYADGVLTFEVRHTSWVDDAAKRRHVLLPAGTQIDTSDPDAWRFPQGTRIWKEFFVDGRAVETRLLEKTGPGPGQWTYVAYVFRPDGSEADATPEGVEDALGTAHDVPDQEGCLECHQGGPDFPLGLSAIQLMRSSFDELVGAGAVPRGTTFGTIPGNDVERRALGYLHANCGHCHVDGHPVSERRSLRLNLPVGLSSPSDAPAFLTAVDAPATDRVSGTYVWIAPGDPDMSQIVARMGQRDEVGMPPLGTEQVDDFGVSAVRAWISAMSAP